MSNLDSTLNLISAKCRSAAMKKLSRNEKITILIEIMALAENQIDMSKRKTLKPKTPKPQLNYRGHNEQAKRTTP